MLPKNERIRHVPVAAERVLVVPTSRFHELGYFQGFSADMDRYLPALLEGDDVEYRPRGEMEQDPSFKQLIPYVLFRWTDCDGVVHLFQYTRGSGQGEKPAARQAQRRRRRAHLVGRRCGQRATMHDVYREGMRRELAEEVVIDTPYAEQVVGLINDDETPVGQVHLGVVHLCDVERPAVEPREADILEAGFRPVGEILARLDRIRNLVANRRAGAVWLDAS